MIDMFYISCKNSLHDLLKSVIREVVGEGMEGLCMNNVYNIYIVT